MLKAVSSCLASVVLVTILRSGFGPFVGRREARVQPQLGKQRPREEGSANKPSGAGINRDRRDGTYPEIDTSWNKYEEDILFGQDSLQYAVSSMLESQA